MHDLRIRPSQPARSALRATAEISFRELESAESEIRVAPPRVLPNDAAARWLRHADRLETLVVCFPHALSGDRDLARAVRRVRRELEGGDLDVFDRPCARRLRQAIEAVRAAPPPSPDPTEPGIRRASRRVLAHWIRKVHRRARRFTDRTPKEAWIALRPVLRRLAALTEIFEGVSTPELSRFRSEVDRFVTAIERAGDPDAGDAGDPGSAPGNGDDAETADAGSDDAGSDDAGSDDAGSDDAGSDDAGSDDAGPTAWDAWRRFRRRRVARLAVPDL